MEEPTLWERISGGFMDSLEGLGTGLLDILVWVLASSPYLLAVGIAAAVIIAVVKKHRKPKKAAKKQNPGTPSEETQQ